MNSIVFGFVLIVAVAVSAQAETYTNKYDNVDIDQILKSDRLVLNYFNCLMDTDSCTPDGAELRKILPDAIKTGCEKCSEKHREAAKKISHFIIDNKPDLWKQVESKYDPEGTYRMKYQAEIKKAGF